MTKQQCGHENGPWKCERPAGHKGKHGCSVRGSDVPVTRDECRLWWLEPDTDDE